MLFKPDRISASSLEDPKVPPLIELPFEIVEIGKNNLNQNNLNLNQLVLLPGSMEGPNELKGKMVEILAQLVFKKTLETLESGESPTSNEERLQKLKSGNSQNNNVIQNNNKPDLAEVISFALKELLKNTIAITFDGSMQNATGIAGQTGRSHEGSILIDHSFINSLFSKLLIKLRNHNFLTTSPSDFLNILQQELNNLSIPSEIPFSNYDHHGSSVLQASENLDSLTSLEDDLTLEFFGRFFGRFETPSSSLQLFKKLVNLAKNPQEDIKIPKIIYFFESLQASDPDSLMCVVLIKLFEENLDYFINGTPEYRILEFLVEIIDAYDVHAGFVTGYLLESVKLPTFLKNYDKVSLVSTMKKTVLSHMQSTVHEKPENLADFTKIISDTLQDVESFVSNPNDFMTGGQATVLENQLNSNKKPSEQKLLEQEFFEIGNYDIFVLNKAPSDSEILRLQEENKHAIYLILKSGEEICNWSIFMIPELYATSEHTTPEELKNRAEFGKESQMLKNYLNSLAYILNSPSENPETETLDPNQVFNSACEDAFNLRGHPAEKPSFGGGCITGCRNNPIPLNFERMKMAIKYYESKVNLKNNSEISF
jgi:hypothetical protein